MLLNNTFEILLFNIFVYNYNIHPTSHILTKLKTKVINSISSINKKMRERNSTKVLEHHELTNGLTMTATSEILSVVSFRIVFIK